jgi:hypothetical protein
MNASFYTSRLRDGRRSSPIPLSFIGWIQGATPHRICLWVYYHGTMAAVKENKEKRQTNLPRYQFGELFVELLY